MKFGNQAGQPQPTPSGQPQANPNQALMNQFLRGGMSTAQQSNSPLLAAVAPLLAALMMRQGGLAGAGAMAGPAPFMSGFESSNEDLAAYLDDPNLPDWRRKFYVEEMERRMEASRAGVPQGRPRPGYNPPAAPPVTPAPDAPGSGYDTPPPAPDNRWFWQRMMGPPASSDPLGLGPPPEQA